MKEFCIKESRVGPDRLATLDEVRCAMAFSSQSASEPGGTVSTAGAEEFEAAGYMGGNSDKLAWLELLAERLDPKSN
jgi:hypothetical protein